MIKRLQYLIDFLYYFLFQANRKKKYAIEIYFKAAKSVTGIFGYFLAYIALLLILIIRKLSLEIDERWIIIIMIIIGVILLVWFNYTIESWYSKKGKRIYIIKEFDDKYDFKAWPQVYDFMIIGSALLLLLIIFLKLFALII